MSDEAVESMIGRCDTCGAPATGLARDHVTHEVPGEQWSQQSVSKRLKRGCDLHPVRSELIEVTELSPADYVWKKDA